MLLDVLQFTAKEQRKAEYIGQALWLIQKALLTESSFPSYIDYLNMLDGRRKPADTRSVAEIMAQIKSDLLKYAEGSEKQDG